MSHLWHYTYTTPKHESLWHNAFRCRYPELSKMDQTSPSSPHSHPFRPFRTRGALRRERPRLTSGTPCQPTCNRPRQRARNATSAVCLGTFKRGLIDEQAGLSASAIIFSEPLYLCQDCAQALLEYVLRTKVSLPSISDFDEPTRCVTFLRLAAANQWVNHVTISEFREPQSYLRIVP